MPTGDPPVPDSSPAGGTIPGPSPSPTVNGHDAAVNVRAAELRAASISMLLDRMRFADTAGLSYVSETTGLAKRDLYRVLGYRRELKIEHYRDRYLRGDIAERIIEAYPRATWTEGAAVIEDEDPDVETPFEKEVIDLWKRVDGWASFLRVDILAGIGRYAALVIGAPGAFDQELPKNLKAKQVLYLTPLPEDRATIESVDTDPQSARYGLPLYYNCNFTVDLNAKAIAATTGDVTRVHWSRVIHVAEGLLQDRVYGKPRLRAVWNRLDDLDKIVGGGAEATWRRMDPGFQLDVDPAIQLDAAGEELLAEEIEDYVHGDAKFIRTRGSKLNQLSTQVPSFGPNADTIIKVISGTTGIPYRILVGSERGELASTQDRSNWNDRVAERRKEMAAPAVNAFIQRLIDYKALPEPEKFEISWPTEQELDEAEKAKVVATLATANASNVNAGFGPILLADEIRDKVLDMDPLELPKGAPLPPGLKEPDPVPAPLAADGTTPAAQADGQGGQQAGTPPAKPGAPPKPAVPGQPVAPKPAAPVAKAAARAHVDPVLRTAKLVMRHRKMRAARAARYNLAPVQPQPRAAASSTPTDTQQLLAVLEAAIEANNTKVIDAILGMRHDAGSTQEGPG